MKLKFLALLAVVSAFGPLQMSFGQASANPTVALIQSGYTTRAYAAGKVDQDKIAAILECGVRAPSASDGQPWRFTVISDPALAAKLIPASVEGNVLIIVSGTAERKPNSNVDFDCALAVANMNLAAQGLGLGTHIYTGPVRAFGAPAMLKEYRIPQGFLPIAILRVGLIDKAVDATASASKRNKATDVVN